MRKMLTLRSVRLGGRASGPDLAYGCWCISLALMLLVRLMSGSCAPDGVDFPNDSVLDIFACECRCHMVANIRL